MSECYINMGPSRAEIEEFERELAETPETQKIRHALRQVGIEYTCGWLLDDGRRVNTMNVTTFALRDGTLVTAEEDEGTLYVETDAEHLFRMVALDSPVEYMVWRELEERRSRS